YSVFGQDRMNAGRLTMNIGARFDYYRGWIPAQGSLPAGPPPDGVRWSAFFPPAFYPEISRALVWKNVSPRVNAIYKITADGQTLLKASFGLYPTEMLPQH